MSRIAVVLLSMVSTWRAAVADPPPTPQQAADAVLSAVKAKDVAGLEALAARDDPDPWLVADDLLARGEADAAEAFARAAPRPDTERLPEHVATRRGAALDSDARREVSEGNAALAAGKWQEALDAFSRTSPAEGTTTRVRLLFGRGLATRGLGRLEESAAAFLSSSQAAERIGWLARASRAIQESGESAWRRSDFGAALERFTAWQEAAVKRGDRRSEAGALGNVGNAHWALGHLEVALSFQERALGMKRELHDRAGEAMTLANIAMICTARGEFAEALSFQERALAIHRELHDRAGEAWVLGHIGNAHLTHGRFPEALAALELAFEIRQELHDRAGAALVLSDIGIVHYSLGDFPKARSCYERALVVFEEVGDRRAAANTLGNLGNVRTALGDLPGALSFHERALEMKRADGDRRGEARTLGNVGIVHNAMGDYPRALSFYQRALEQSRALGDRASAAMTLGNMGSVHHALGDFATALSLHERALAEKVALGDRFGEALTLLNMGTVYLAWGDYAKALEFEERALERNRALGNRAAEASTLGNVGLVHQLRGDFAKALSSYESALSIHEALGDRLATARGEWNLGTLHGAMGDRAKAVLHLDRAVRESRRLRAAPVLAGSLTSLARVRLEAGDAGLALSLAQQALRELEGTLGGLAEEEGATARGQSDDTFAVGTLAAVRNEDAGEALAFLESGRAGTLLETLGGRRGMRWADVPAGLREAEAEAKAAEARARQSYGTVVAGGDVAEIRRAGSALDDALEGRREVAARIQREAKRVAGLFYPRAATLEEIKGRLGDGQALVLYGLCLDVALAFVLTRDEGRILSLGSADAVRDACEALDASTAQADPKAALDTLRALLVEPLKLPEAAREVIVSPEGPLCYVPFGAIFDRRPVALVPSGTTLALLLEEQRAPGGGVLALGDPDYGSADAGASAAYRRSRPLPALPQTREEAKGVGSTVLLGKDASEEGLAKALAGHGRWRAVHFACHGLVDPERPTLSSLALSRTGADDGFLTATEVLRMEIPTDLVALSACETAKGKVVKGEGIVGLARAFMYAGAPRVLCSLWKVDDEATRALMTRFYERWNPKTGSPGIGSAEALREAQEFVRSVEKWKHPYYWAAWVLWGLPS